MLVTAKESKKLCHSDPVDRFLRCRYKTDVQKSSDITARLGRIVRERRMELGMTQERLAAAAGINRSYIGDIERGARNAALTTLAKLADALDLELSELIRRVERGS